MEKENVQFRKNFIWNVLGTGLNAFNSLFFMIIVTRLNGVDQAGIFTIAFSTACIIYFVGVYAGRIYQVTELNKEITDKEFIVNRSISTILMLILVILFSVIRGYNLYKSTMFLLLTLYKALEAFSDVLYGILQKNDRLEIVGKSFFMKALFSVILFFIIDYITKNMITSTISIILVNIIILIVFDFKNVLKFVDLKTKVKKEADVTVDDTDIQQTTFSYTTVYKDSFDDPEQTAKDIKSAFEKSEDKDFSAAVSEQGITSSDVTITTNDPDYDEIGLDKDLVDEIMKLNDGECGYYTDENGNIEVFYMTAKNDKDATDAKRSSKEEEEKTEYYTIRLRNGKMPQNLRLMKKHGIQSR